MDINMYKQKDSSGDLFVSYADLLTLLLTFFAYIVSISVIDSAKLVTASQSIKYEFAKMVPHQEMSPMTQLNARLGSMVEQGSLTNNVNVQYVDNRVEIMLDQVLLFDAGSSRMKPLGRKFMKSIVSSLPQEEYRISIEGHTDNSPISSRLYRSNWHLSAIRAAEVVYYLQAVGVPDNKLRLIGYGHTKPVVPNSTRKNKSKNRRVAIIIEDRSV
ncbi:OmpA family protein [bacterium]|jgi:chemotaxis protein MotB|nr:OmpA family protein [bacterium]